MMCVRVVLVDLPEERRRLIDLTHFAARKSAPATPYFRGKSELRSRKNANCRASIFGCGEPSSAGIEVVGGQFVANLGRTRMILALRVIGIVPLPRSVEGPIGASAVPSEPAVNRATRHSQSRSHLPPLNIQQFVSQVKGTQENDCEIAGHRSQCVLLYLTPPIFVTGLVYRSRRARKSAIYSAHPEVTALQQQRPVHLKQRTLEAVSGNAMPMLPSRGAPRKFYNRVARNEQQRYRQMTGVRA
jgi:hypothetical protein